MTAYVALLRAVNLGGATTVLKAALVEAASTLGYAHAQTFIASGNLLFAAEADEATVKTALAGALTTRAGKPVDVMIRTAPELAAVVLANPFADRPGNTVAAIFLDATPPADVAATARHRVDEEIAIGTRALYVWYGSAGIGRARLVIPAARAGTARNMNTVAKLAELVAALPG